MCSRIEAPKARNVFANRSAEGAKCVRESKRRRREMCSRIEAPRREMCSRIEAPRREMCSRIEAPKARNVFANRSAEARNVFANRSAEGAKYDSQGQARKRVAPGTDHQEFVRALKERNNLLRPPASTSMGQLGPGATR